MHGVHLSVAAPELLVAEVHLGVHPRRCERQGLVLALFGRRFGDAVIAPELHHIVVHRLWRQVREVGVMLFQPVVHLRRRRARELGQPLHDELLVGLEAEWFVGNVVRELLELFPAHLQVLLHSPEVSIGFIARDKK